MPSTDLIFRFLGIDAGAGREFDRMAGKVDTAGVKWKDWALGAGIAVGTVAAAAIHLADQWDQAHTRLEGAVTNVGGNFDALAGQVSGLDSHMAKFGFTATDVESSLAPLVTATKNPTQAMHLMGLAADVARGRNIALKDATNLLVKVETGHVSLLGRYGIATKTASGSTITMTQALQRLTQLYGGDAQRFADTFSGKLAALSAHAQDLGIKLGNFLIPIVTKLIDGFLKVGSVIGDVAGFFQRNRAAASALATVLTAALLPSLARLAIAVGRMAAWNLAAIWLTAKGAVTGFARAEGEATSAAVTLGSKLQKGGLIAGGLFAVTAAVSGIDDALGGVSFNADAMTASLDRLGKTGVVNGEITKAFGTNLQNLAGQLHLSSSGVDILGFRFHSLGDTFTHTGADFKNARDGVTSVDQALASLVSGGSADLARQAFQRIAAAGRSQGDSLDFIKSKFPAYEGALKAAGSQADNAAGATQRFATAMNHTAGQSQSAADAAQHYSDVLHGLTDPVFALNSALVDLRAKQAAAKTALDKYGASSGKTRQANLDLAQSAVTVQGAAHTLAAAVNDGSVKIGQAKHYLNDWVQSGLLTKKQADSVAGSFKGLQGRAFALSGLSPLTLKINTNESQVSSSVSQLTKQLAGLTNAPHVIHITTLKQILTLPTKPAPGSGSGGGSSSNSSGWMGTPEGQQGRKQSLDFTAAIRSGIPDAQKAAADLVTAATASVAKHTKSPTTAKTVKESAKHVAHLLFIGLRDGWRGESSSLKSALSTPLQNALAHMTTVLGNELSKQQAQLSKAEASYKSLRQARTQAIKSLQDTVTGSADISGVLGLTDVNGNTYTGNVRSLLGSQLSVIRDEASKIGRLRKMGLSEALLRQISAAAPADAVTLANQILSGKDGSIASLNRQESLIQRYAKQTATTVVESPGERHQLEQAKAQVRLQREQVKEQRKTNHHLERIAARDIAHGVSITLSGHTFNPSKPHDLRKLVAELKKLGHNVSVG